MNLVQKISLNSMLFAFVFFASIFFTFADKSGSYMYNLEPEFLTFSSVLLISIILNHYYKSIFLEILIFYVVVFFFFRICLLTYPNIPNQFLLNDIHADDIKNSFFILTVCFISFVFSILIVNPRVNRNLPELQSKLVFSVLLFCFFMVSINFYISTAIGGDTRLLGTAAIIFTIFSSDNMVFLSIVTFVLCSKNDLKKYWYLISPMIFIFVLNSLYNGTKAGIFLYILYFLMATWTLKGVIRLSLLQLITSAFILFFGIILFFIGSYLRVFSTGSSTLIDSLAKIPSIDAETIQGTLFALSYRIGYFDDFVNFVSNEIYWSVVTFQNYFQAIVDKLTPGFDLFGVAFVSRLFHEAKKLGHPPEDGVMNSIQMTGFAENYILFGYFVIITYIVILLFFKYSLKFFKQLSPISSGLFSTILVHLYWKWIEGYGYDMLLINELAYRLIFLLFVITFILREIKITPININFNSKNAYKNIFKEKNR